jgi:glycosyltransferase involved in cell wall biosynthesis
MRILILTPTALPSVSGNAMTAERWRCSLAAMGEDVRVLAAEGLQAAALVRELSAFSPDILHAHHATRTGALLLDPALEPVLDRLPMTVSPGGTDVHLDMKRKEGGELIVRIMLRARVIVVQEADIASRLLNQMPRLADRIVRVPKSFLWLGRDPFDLRAAAGCVRGDLLFFLPAGVRPVKGNLECLLALERVHVLRPQVRAVFAGPGLDQEYAAKFEREIERLGHFARWIRPISPRAMRAAYEGADVVLNASFSEGLSNVLLEAAAAGKPVLASDIPGNRWPVLGVSGEAPSGLLFDPRDPDDFVRQALLLIDNDGSRRCLGELGLERARRWPSPEDEAAALLGAYRRALGRPS